MIIPRRGDVWEYQLPGKPKKRKEIGTVYRVWKHYVEGTRRVPVVWWSRRPKGRHTGIRVRVLLKYGRRISTKAERDATFAERFGREKGPHHSGLPR